MEYNVVYGNLVGSVTVVTLATAKMNSNIPSDQNDQDDLLNILLDASIEDAENYLGTPLKKRQLNVELANWPETFQFPVYPVTAITSVTYRDGSGTEQTLATSEYELFSMEGRHYIRFNDVGLALDADTHFAIKISVEAGYETNEIPNAVKSAVLMRFSHKELFREDVPTSYNRMFQAALRPYKLYE
ncbi:head-tail connector protein [Flagellimonas sp.]|uniref:head-tail connector protein n=1 Tax=Flagellimonas sp. TaxID=2058762 RepID=UPI003F49DF25